MENEMNTSQTLQSITATVTELQEYADSGGSGESAFNLCVNKSELDMAEGILFRLLDMVTDEIYRRKTP